LYCTNASLKDDRELIYVATWNLNHQAGNRRVRPEAADTAITLGADILVFTEFFPRQHENQFRATLANAGWNEQLVSALPSEVAGKSTEPEPNRIFIASKLPLAPMALDLPTFDQQFPANLLGVTLPSLGLSVLAVRVPAYSKAGRQSLLATLTFRCLQRLHAAAITSAALSRTDGTVQNRVEQPSSGTKERRPKSITFLQQTTAFLAVRYAFERPLSPTMQH
jgi:hypothetical protein